MYRPALDKVHTFIHSSTGSAAAANAEPGSRVPGRQHRHSPLQTGTLGQVTYRLCIPAASPVNLDECGWWYLPHRAAGTVKWANTWKWLMTVTGSESCDSIRLCVQCWGYNGENGAILDFLHCYELTLLCSWKMPFFHQVTAVLKQSNNFNVIFEKCSSRSNSSNLGSTCSEDQRGVGRYYSQRWGSGQLLFVFCEGSERKYLRAFRSHCLLLQLLNSAVVTQSRQHVNPCSNCVPTKPDLGS